MERMAKKSVEGQMDLFELFSSVEELEEKVKGVPEEAILEVADVSKQQVAMQKTFRNCETGEIAVIAYLNYNKVYQKLWNEAPIIYQFEKSKDAVDYYVSLMEQFSENRQMEVQKEQATLMEASVIPWTRE